MKIAHLPPGHAPGPQSRRAARSSPVALLLLAAFAIGAVVAGAVLFASRSSGGHSSSKTAGAVVFWVIGLLMVVFCAWLYRRTAGGPRLPGVSVTVDRSELTRGDGIHATVTVQGDADGLELGLVCTAFVDTKRETVNNNGTTSTSRVVERSDVVAQWREVPAATPMHSVEFTIPGDGPFSYEGATVSWAYRISARRPKRMRTDPHIDVPIWVKP